MARIVLDAGHGGKDSGATGNNLLEKDINLEITLKVGHFLKDYDCDIFYTRKEHKFISLDDRTDYSTEINADFFLSFHANAGGGEGFESYVYPTVKDKKTGKLQDIIHKSIMDFLKRYDVTDRGKKTKDLHVLRETECSAVLIENLFVDNEKDALLLKRNSFRNLLANAIGHGVVRALDLKKKDKPLKPPELGDTIFYYEVIKINNDNATVQKVGIITSMNGNQRANLCIFSPEGIYFRYNVPYGKTDNENYFTIKK